MYVSFYFHLVYLLTLCSEYVSDADDKLIAETSSVKPSEKRL